MKLIIAGSREFTDYDYLVKVLKDSNLINSIEEVVCGMARGADLLGKRFAEEHNIPVKEFPADWKLYGKRAGFVRNEQMAEYGTDTLIFWDGVSRGSKHMINISRKAGLPTYVINYIQPQLGLNNEF
jgi:hypothetical protein